MASKYVDVTAIMQVIGNVFNNPQLLDFTDKYTIVDEDFSDQFHKIAFGAIYKLHELGVQKINLSAISDFLSSRPKSEAIFKQQKGEEWLLKVAENCTPSAFDYYYNRLKNLGYKQDKNRAWIKASLTETPKSSFWNKLYGKVPEMLDIARLLGNYHNNEQVYNEQIKGINPDLLSSYYTYSRVFGDEATK